MTGQRDWAAEFPAFTRTDKEYRLVLSEDARGTATDFQAPEVAGACYSSVLKVLHPAIEANLIEATLEPREDGALSVRLSPGANCGFVTVDGRAAWGRDISIEILPKLNAANIFTLLSLSGNPERFLKKHLTNLGESPSRSLVQLLGMAYGNSLQQLISRSGLRGLHETKHDRLPFRIRGRVNVSQYLHEYAVGRQHVFPCTYPTHTLDNKINRLLRWALHAITSACRNSGAVTTILEQVDSAFVGVKLESMPPIVNSTLEGLPSSFDAYWQTGTIQLAKMIARSSNLGVGGGAMRSSAVAVPMHSVFEAAFARVVACWSGLSLELIAQQEWRIVASSMRTGGKGGTFVPDIVLPPDEGRFGVVADTKWKSGMDQGLENDLGKVFLRAAGIKLYNADIYQMLGYMAAAKQVHGSDFIGLIVYPVAAAEDADLSPLRIYVGTERKPMPVYLLPWEVGTKCFERLSVTWRTIESLRSVDAAKAWL